MTNTAWPAELLIVSSQFHGLDPRRDVTWEIAALFAAARQAGVEATGVDPRTLAFDFDAGLPWPRVLLGSREISRANAMLVRGTRGIEDPLRLLAEVLHAQNCFLVDPIERLRNGGADKTVSTKTRHDRKVGSHSLIIYGFEAGRVLLESLASTSGFPILFKPLRGSQGAGITRAYTQVEALAKLQEALDESHGDETGILVQVDEMLQAEWRVLTLGSQVLGCVQKLPAATGLPANAAQGATFTVDDRQDVVDLVAAKAVRGLVGVDVGLARDGRLVIIEENYAPQWRAFEAATGINVAEAIIEHIKAAAVL